MPFLSSLDLDKQIQDLNNDFLLHNESKNDAACINRHKQHDLVCVDVSWSLVLGLYSGWVELCKCIFIDLALYKLVIFILVICNLVYFSLYTFFSGANWQKKELFVMAVFTVSGGTLPGNLTIIPSAQKWVFHAIYQHAFPLLYSSEVCSRNRFVLTDEVTSQFKPFESLISTTNIFNPSKVMICTFHGIWMAFKKAIFSNYGKSKYALIYGGIIFPICIQSICIWLNR